MIINDMYVLTLRKYYIIILHQLIQNLYEIILEDLSYGPRYLLTNNRIFYL